VIVAKESLLRGRDGKLLTMQSLGHSSLVAARAPPSRGMAEGRAWHQGTVLRIGKDRELRRIAKPVSFRAQTEFRNAERRQERNPEDAGSTWPLQGISSMLSPFNFIFLPQLCARSSHRGLVFSMRSIFFFRRHDLICFSRLIITVTSLHPA
jgi:hypothetical protein